MRRPIMFCQLGWGARYIRSCYNSGDQTYTCRILYHTQQVWKLGVWSSLLKRKLSKIQKNDSGEWNKKFNLYVLAAKLICSRRMWLDTRIEVLNYLSKGETGKQEEISPEVFVLQARTSKFYHPPLVTFLPLSHSFVFLLSLHSISFKRIPSNTQISKLFQVPYRTSSDSAHFLLHRTF
jgi:hypothetical protein